MKVTPSLRNLNQDPLMSDSLVYYLKPGDTLVTTPDAGVEEGASVIHLGGGGMMPNHATITYSVGPPRTVRLLPRHCSRRMSPRVRETRAFFVGKSFLVWQVHPFLAIASIFFSRTSI